MGLFDTIFKVATAPLDPLGLLPVPGGGGVGGILNAPLEIATELVGGVLDVPGQVIGGALDTVTGITGGVLGGVAGGNGAVDMTGFGGGNGSVATRTIVETMDLRTGKIVRRKIMEGSPHLMNKDINAAKKVFRSVRKLDSRLPKKTRAVSKTKQLADAAIDRALRDTNNGDERAIVVKT